MAGILARLSSVLDLASGDPALRARLLTAENAADGTPSVRVRVSVVERLDDHSAPPSVRSRILTVERLDDHSAPPAVRSRVLVVEALQAILEPIMSTEVFPMLLAGLTWDVHKKPIFSNKIATHVSGEETATSYYQNPKWEYTLSYDYLPDIPKQVGDTDLHQILGFFLNRHGRFDTFLFNDPDDNAVTVGFQTTFDGVTTDFRLVRGIGGFYEPVGYYNAGLQIWLDLDETFNVPAPAGPYTHTVAHAATYVQTDSVTINGVAATVGAGAGQYTVAAGVYTFNAADTGKAVDVRYRYLVDPSAYTFTYPNVLAFHVAPIAGATAYASFSYYFIVRFIEDTQDYNKFANQLWELHQIGLRSIPSQ